MRLLHVMLRVKDLKESIKFYSEIFDMKLLRTKDYPKGRFTLAFLGYGKEEDTTALELTHNWDIKEYDIGSGYGHIAIGVKDIYKTCIKLREQGVNIIREPGPMKESSTILAFVEDPNGYKIELLEKP